MFLSLWVPFFIVSWFFTTQKLQFFGVFCLYFLSWVLATQNLKKNCAPQPSPPFCAFILFLVQIQKQYLYIFKCVFLGSANLCGLPISIGFKLSGYYFFVLMTFVTKVLSMLTDLLLCLPFYIPFFPFFVYFFLWVCFICYAFWPFTMCGHLNVLLFIPDNREKKWSTGRPGEWLHLILPKQQVMLPLAFLPYFYLWFYHLSCRMMLLVVLSTMPSLQEDCWLQLCS